MILRRYYPKGFKGRTYSDEYITYLKGQGAPTEIIDNAKTELILSREEQEIFYKQCCDLVMTKTRWVLDNLDSMTEFKVNWQSYKKSKKGSKNR